MPKNGHFILQTLIGISWHLNTLNYDFITLQIANSHFEVIYLKQGLKHSMEGRHMHFEN